MTTRAPALCRRAGAGAAVLALILGISACSAPSPTVSAGSGGSAASPPGTAPASAAVPRQDAPPSGPAVPPDQSAVVAAALKKLVAATPQPNRDQVRESLIAAGFPSAGVEITASRTPTGLAADAVDIGVLDQRACVMAQVRSGSVETSVLPVLPNGRCFVGSVQR